ncbi:serine/threonine protein kinase [Candidatus Nitrotoga sp. M5]|uniref:serine/threonine protein kinase n=1 Tax=Candidatus Nitrotoga sp. M5 TaxID=2890409 RepID=UPI001EF33865|nr:serine/threonine protein kinase [Candidatus Nitrotoga sp. M5]CAH1386632.1 Serine/threonine protein kinase [Candidatus Nitrotoga sp. M5]
MSFSQQPVSVETPSKPRDERLKVGRFIIRRWLGSGLQGKVFLAFDPVLERQVAIKWLHPTDSDKQSENRGIFPSEARIVAKLEHPNIVPLYEAGLYRDFPYLVFAYVEGMTLREKREQCGAMPVKEALPMFGAILSGVACAHAQGILHLDLSPSNIMIDSAGVPRIMDFGLAKFMGVDAATDSSDELRGSPLYMSPEHFSNHPLTTRSDVFVLGLILFEMVSGKSPVPTENLQTIIDTIANSELDLGGMDRLGLNPGLQLVIRRALSHDANKRFVDATEMKLAIDELLEPADQDVDHSTVLFLFKRLERKTAFPALSNNLVEINRLTDENNHANVDKLVNIVLRDYSITNKLLQLANSSFYGRASSGVKTISDAIHLLGLNVIRTTCNGLMYFDALKGGDQNLKDALICSFVSAFIGRHFAVRLGYQDLAEEAFICGMFHRLGKSLTIFYFQEEFNEIERLIQEYGLSDETASAGILGISYSHLGMAVAERWKFPEAIRGSIQCLNVGKLPKPTKTAELQQQIAAFANELCELAANTSAEQGCLRLEEFSDRFAELVLLSPAELIQLLEVAFIKLKEFSPILGFDFSSSLFVSSVDNFLTKMVVKSLEESEQS